MSEPKKPAHAGLSRQDRIERALLAVHYMLDAWSHCGMPRELGDELKVLGDLCGEIRVQSNLKTFLPTVGTA